MSASSNHALDHETKVPSILAALVIGCFLSTASVSLRMYTRLVIIRATGIDDWMIVFAQVLNIGSGAAIALETYYGMGRHVWTVPAEHVVPYTKCLYASILIYNAALTLVKVSLLLQYRRIFTLPSMQRATSILLVIIIAWGVTVIVMLSNICVPIQALWDRTVNGHCMPLIPAYYAPAAINIATDFSTWIVPLPIIKSLQLPKRQKIILMFIFGLGFFTCITSLVRLSTLKEATHTEDPTWDNTGAATWSYVELSMATLAACLPTLRPLANKIMPKFLAGSQKGSSSQYNMHHHQYVRQDNKHSGAGTSTWVSAKLGLTTIGGSSAVGGGASRKRGMDGQSIETLTGAGAGDGEVEYDMQEMENKGQDLRDIRVETAYTVHSSTVGETG